MERFKKHVRMGWVVLCCFIKAQSISWGDLKCTTYWGIDILRDITYFLLYIQGYHCNVINIAFPMKTITHLARRRTFSCLEAALVYFTCIWIPQMPVQGVASGEGIPTFLAHPHPSPLSVLPGLWASTTCGLVHMPFSVVNTSKHFVAVWTWILLVPLCV